jgi:hypothetical protein
MGHTGVVFHFEREFREAKTPTGLPTLRIREVHDPSEGMVVRSYGEFRSLQIGSQMRNSPDNCEALLLGR